MRGWSFQPRNITVLTELLHRRVAKRECGQCIGSNMLTSITLHKK